MAEPGQQRLGRQQLCPRGGQLDRQRQPVQPGTDRRDISGVPIGDHEAGPDHPRLLSEQHRRTGPRHVRGAAAAWDGQRRHRLLIFPRHVQRAPGCRQDDQLRRGRQQRGHHLPGAIQLFQVVQHQQDAALAQVTRDHLGLGPVAGHA